MRKFIIFLILSISLLNAEIPTLKKADDFTLKDLKNKNRRFSEETAKYKFTIVNFWATWCIPCRGEMKKINDLYSEYKDKDVHVISISVDDPKTVSRVNSYIRANRCKQQILLDTNNDVMRTYHVTNPPFTFIVNKKMEILYEHTGYRKGDVLLMKKEIDNLLKNSN